MGTVPDTVLLPTVLVTVWNPSGASTNVRALIDTGAQGCLMSTRLSDALELCVSRHDRLVTGIGDVQVSSLKGQTTLTFSRINDPYPRVVTSAVVMDHILGNHPRVQLSDDVLTLTSGLDLADPLFHSPGPVDLLIGSDVLGWVFTGDMVDLRSGLVALSTLFGYAIMGPIQFTPSEYRAPPQSYAGYSLNKIMQRFWEIEEPPVAPRVNPEHEECELIYRNNTGRLTSGRLITRLPFLPSPPQLGQSRTLAEKRLVSMENKMRRDPLLRQKYIEFMREYIQLGHMSPAQVDWSTTEHYFLPHHAVIKPSTGKLRTVFDGSAPTSTGVSLNQCLHSGPKLHRDIIDIILNFRRHQVVIGADIRMMFRQTLIHPKDRRFQLILWRESPDDPMIVYELNTNTYGLKSSPFIAIRSLHELAERERLRFPRAAAVLKTDLYVDDVCTGASTVEEALLLRDELISILAAGGYELRKWLSNSPELLAGIPQEHQQEPHLFEDVEDPNMIAVLGMQYLPVQDVFTYKVDLDIQRPWSKRSVLSTIARTFDPNGWISPVMFRAKCMMQKLWTVGVSWDEVLPSDLLREWTSFIYTLVDVNRIALPRCFLPAGRLQASLHGFCDASEKGYAASVYLRTVNPSGETRVTLVMAKCKVAPLRTRHTIPKLELSGALLVAKLLAHVYEELVKTVKIQKVVAWSDSEVVLAWLRTSPHVLETFVGNRVSQINGFEIPIEWRHVPGEMNPADCASRGCNAPDLVSHPLWWGPDWLARPESSWPPTRYNQYGNELPGLKAGVVCSTLPPDRNKSDAIRIMDVSVSPGPVAAIPTLVPNAAQVKTRPGPFLLGWYSRLNTLLEVTAWIRRFIHNIRMKKRHPELMIKSQILTFKERKEALTYWVKVTQIDSFAPELKALQGGSILKGAIAKLNPFVDPEGLIRVGGRLRKANLPFGRRHPLLLPKVGPLVQLLVHDRHVRNFHCGCNALLAILQREYWILSARRVIRGMIFRCIPCYKLKATTMQPQMGDLPADRVNEARPFSGVATDFAGPFMIKSSSLRNAKILKAYLCVFVCLSTKAVHLEVVSALSTEAFIAALDRFVSRRGLPSLIRSDCGTNYKGADRYLKEVFEFLYVNNIVIGSALARRGITWRFDPAVCPHWGGIFEAAVKSAKTHLKRVIGDTSLTFEEIATVFCKIEAVLNSRPLCPLSADPNDLEALSPGHFLIGQPLNALPEYPFQDVKMYRLSRFQLLQQITQNFWHRWSLEYLHILQQRVKWTDKTDPPKIGDLVMLKEPNLQSMHWRRGRILNLILGADGVPRVAEVRVGDSILKRAVATLSRLPVD